MLKLYLPPRNGQPLEVLPGQNRFGHGVLRRQGHAIHRLPLLVLKQGSQTIEFAVHDDEESAVVAGQRAKRLQNPVVAIHDFTIDAHDRQIDVPRLRQTRKALRLPPGVFDEKLGLRLPTHPDPFKQGIQHPGHQTRLVRQIIFRHRQGGPVRTLLDDQGHDREDQHQGKHCRQNQAEQPDVHEIASLPPPDYRYIRKFQSITSHR